MFLLSTYCVRPVYLFEFLDARSMFDFWLISVRFRAFSICPYVSSFFFFFFFFSRSFCLHVLLLADGGLSFRFWLELFQFFCFPIVSVV